MDAMQYKMQLGVQRIVAFSAVPLLIGLNYPAGVFVYWISNNLLTGLQVCHILSRHARESSVCAICVVLMLACVLGCIQDSHTQ